MCDYCDDTGMIHILRFFKSKYTPYEVVEPCFCNAGLSWSKTGYCFQQSQIGLHYHLVRQTPMVFVDNRIYDYDLVKSRSFRSQDKVLTKAEIQERIDGQYVIGKVG